jgi:hypothetical protein
VRTRLARLRIDAKEFTPAELMVEFAERLCSVSREWGFDIATCAEEIDLDGIAHNRCIDDALMVELFSQDAALMDFLGFRPALFGPSSSRTCLKDRGQRRAWSCIVSKDIGMYGTCTHLCAYCYANVSGNARFH